MDEEAKKLDIKEAASALLHKLDPLTVRNIWVGVGFDTIYVYATKSWRGDVPLEYEGFKVVLHENCGIPKAGPATSR